MIKFRFGGREGRSFNLVPSNQLVAVRSRTRGSISSPTTFEGPPLSRQARDILGQFDLAVQFRDAGVEVLRARTPQRRPTLRDRARAILKEEPGIQFAGRVLCDPASKAPVLYTENFFVKFDGDQSGAACRRILRRYGLAVASALDYARNAYFVKAPEGSGLAVFEIAEKLLGEASVELCHPELVREVRRRAAFPQQWHLKQTTVNGQTINAHANVEAAWALSEGEGITIAVIDDGVDLDHEEFRSSAKIVAPRDVTRQNNNPRPGSGDNHGTACAGVACADGRFGASGVAPQARLLPIRLASGLGSIAEANAFIWAAQNGADVISCSWGPADGDWWDPADPTHHQAVPLPDSTRLAIDWAVRNGRAGKGCVVFFAAGNGNETVENDGYASYEKVTAVAACNDTGKRSVYSDFGSAVWCAFPSNDMTAPKTPGIWTTDRSGSVGYNPGQPSRGDAAGHYTNSFGGTSSACPGAAGVAALVLARNPNLRWEEVRDILKRSCDRIDPAGGRYDSAGHSDLYGFGRLNARKAVELAVPAVALQTALRSAVQAVPIRDLRTAKLVLAVADTNPLKGIKVIVDIEHTYIGDLVVRILPPTATGVGPITLHNREGGGTDNLKKTYDPITTPALLALLGRKPAGKWTLSISDKAALDTGQIKSLTLELQW